ncbi:phosphotransferase family protein [Nocardia fusca]|uniref:phosphotransferase family protein n=1 Tax=Nocardia fusca TaxID=941183 RepID=UPI0037C7D29C
MRSGNPGDGITNSLTCAADGGAFDPDTVVPYLRTHGLIADGTAVVSVEPLSGGVSADVIAVETESDAWVVKHVLPQLRVAQPWPAAQTRALTEARAMQVAAELLPDQIPSLVFVDPVAFVIVQRRAPRNLADWRVTLLNGGRQEDIVTARILGDALAVLHNGTAGRTDLIEAFGDLDSFIELRIDPFHHTVAAALPEAADAIGYLVGDLLRNPRCLVHGDFSPKNVLADGPQVRLLDWEVAHVGNPVFDVASLLAHLVCKAVHRRDIASHYAQCASQFFDTYTRTVKSSLLAEDRSVVAHLSAVVLARTDGKSLAPYLTQAEADRARNLALGWLLAGETELRDVWSELT